jgi:hypothetical protein
VVWSYLKEERRRQRTGFHESRVETTVASFPI